MPAAVVFDCDGVLVDSERLAWEAWRTVLGRHGVSVHDTDIQTLTGRTQNQVYDAFANEGALPPVEQVLEAVTEQTLERIRDHLEAFEDAPPTVDVLSAAGVPLAVASSSPRIRLDASLIKIGVDHAFPVTVAGDEVTRGKPAPDLYLAAAAGLGVDARDCVAVEDTGSGVASAQAAGMRVVAIERDHINPATLEEAEVVLAALSAEQILAAHAIPTRRRA